MKKHAYLIMAHNDFGSLKHLLAAIDDKRNDIYLHIDAKTWFVDQQEIGTWVKESVLFFTPRMDVRWGHTSLVECELLLLEQATLHGQYHYYHLLSGIDFPLKSQDEIHEYLSDKDREFLAYHYPGEYGDDYMHKIKYYHPFMRWCGKGGFDGPGIKNAIRRTLSFWQWKIVEKQKEWGIDRTKRYKDFQFVKGCNWFSITDDFARYIIACRRQIIKMSRFMNTPDEVFMASLAINSQYKDRIENESLRCIDWKRGDPYEYTIEDLPQLLGAKEFFARKISYTRQPELVRSLEQKISPGKESAARHHCGSEPLVSVVVPIYNVENYLDKCLESIQNQTYRNIEVIMVDDGSTDRSGSIAKEFSQKDKRFLYCHQSNGGLSVARNSGIEASTGEYIAFIDSDDYIDSTFIEKLLIAALEKDADIVSCGYYKETNIVEKIGYDSYETLSRTAAMRVLGVIFPKEYTLMVIACNKLFRKTVFDTVRFKVGKIHEDEFTIHRIIDESDIVVTIPDVLYHYVVRTTSITGARNKADLRHFDIVDAHRDRVSCCKKQIYSDFYRLIVYSMFEEIIQLMLRYSFEDYDKYHLSSRFRKIMFSECIKHYDQLDRHQKKEYFLAIFSPKMYVKRIKRIEGTAK